MTVLDVPADGYRLRLVDHPAAFDREGFYGDAAGDYADNAWRFGLFCRAALEALRADGRPLDVLHLHDWHTGPAAIYRENRYADDPILGGSAILLTLHNLAYHGWTPRSRLGQLGLAPGDGVVARDADGIDLLLAGIDRADLVNTVSPGFAAEALTPEFGMGLDGALRAKGDRFVGILNGLDTTVWDPATDADLAAPYSRADRAGKAACRADLLSTLGFDPEDDGAVIGMIGRLDPQKGFDLLADASPDAPRARRPARRPGERAGGPRGPVPGDRPCASAAGRLHRAVRPGDGPQDLRRRRLLRDAVALRAVRPGPDDLAPLRDAADRPSGRRAGRHGHRRGDEPGRGDRVRVHGRVRGRAARGLRRGDRAARGRRRRVGGAARSRDGGRLRLGDRVAPRYVRRLPARGRRSRREG